ncbi:hypothetical protein NQZ68_008956 [Dissostichus eleginoides]|nr:hypothetical protein NQZ68_008956 [Dissostichus eleginoides]
MSGCAKRCKQGLIKFAVTMHKLLTGTLIKVDLVLFSLFSRERTEGDRDEGSKQLIEER